MRVCYREFSHNPYAYIMNGHYQNKQQIKTNMPLMMVPYYNSNTYDPYYMVKYETEKKKKKSPKNLSV